MARASSHRHKIGFSATASKHTHFRRDAVHRKYSEPAPSRQLPGGSSPSLHPDLLRAPRHTPLVFERSGLPDAAEQKLEFGEQFATHKEPSLRNALTGFEGSGRHPTAPVLLCPDSCDLEVCNLLRSGVQRQGLLNRGCIRGISLATQSLRPHPGPPESKSTS